MDAFNGKRLFDVKELCMYTGLGKARATAWGKKIGAARHMGRRVFYDRVAVDRALDAMTDREDGFARLYKMK